MEGCSVSSLVRRVNEWSEWLVDSANTRVLCGVDNSGPKRDSSSSEERERMVVDRSMKVVGRQVQLVMVGKLGYSSR